jgi:hypothetical protein
MAGGSPDYGIEFLDYYPSVEAEGQPLAGVGEGADLLDAVRVREGGYSWLWMSG